MPTYTQTSTYGKPAIAYPAFPGVVAPGNPNPLVIPLILTSMNSPQEKTAINVITSMPITDGNFSYGGNALGEGTKELSKVDIEGTIDTPTTAATENYAGFTGPVQVSALTINGYNVTWADFIIMCIEGRVSPTWQRFDPLWFRDPYGRQFTKVRFLDFQASYVEAIPGRTSFTGKLLVI